MSRYIEILAVQRPFPFNVDSRDRVMFSMNFTAQADSNVDEWEEELAQIIVDAGDGTLDTDLFIGPEAPIPTGDGPYITIIDTGGQEQVETHDGITYERLSAQIVVRAQSYKTARTRALAVWRDIHGTRGQTITAA